MNTIAVLFAEKDGCYSKVPNLDLWDIDRDARKYNGPYPVVAHPPCSRWCRLAELVQSRYGYKVGDDGGCFKSALDSVRKYGGILEHPAYSKAWKKYGLNKPPAEGGWVNADFQGGWTCQVEQFYYGHKARKRTWLYAYNVELKNLKWGSADSTDIIHAISRLKSDTKKWTSLTKKEAISTPPAFRDILIDIARNVKK